MFDIPVEDLVFVVCTLVGGGLLLVTVLVDDIIGAFIDFDIGGVSLMPLLLSFISMFGVGGLFATQVLDVHGGQAAIVGDGLWRSPGMGVAYILFGLLRRAEAAEPFSTRDLVGDEAFVAVGIPAGRNGSVLVKKEGQTHEFSATASDRCRGRDHRPSDRRCRLRAHRRDDHPGRNRPCLTSSISSAAACCRCSWSLSSSS